MKEFAKKHLFTIIGVVGGAAAGYFYWQQIGCVTGTCAITSKPFNSAVYGAVIGGLLFSMIKKNKKESNEISGNN